MRKYKIAVTHPASAYETGELAKMFLPPEQFETEEREENEAPDLSRSFSLLKADCPEGDEPFGEAENGMITDITPAPEEFIYKGPVEEKDIKKIWKNAVKRGVYSALSRDCGKTLPWGILTGVKPVKIVRELEDRGLSEREISEYMKNYYFVSDEKTDLLMEILRVQRPYNRADRGFSKKAGIYLGIPFCPTRCVYCSFTSNVAKEGEIDRYLEALHSEIDYVSSAMRKVGTGIETFYIGGGTPTTLNEGQLDGLLTKIQSSFDLDGIEEFTVEAGRPDTINKGKLEIIKSHGIERISINPQSMNARTLEAIGRKHSPEDIISAYETAREVGIKRINMDLIAGLPGEEPDDFKKTLEIVGEMNPENVTVHTLALKRASKLREEDRDYNYREAERLSAMVEDSFKSLSAGGCRPYYLYRQKYMAGNFENVGWSKPGAECIFNIRTMDEKQDTIALGAGGISKRYFAGENRIERAANVSNYEIYIDRLDEMKERKNRLFGWF